MTNVDTPENFDDLIESVGEEEQVEETSEEAQASDDTIIDSSDDTEKQQQAESSDGKEESTVETETQEEAFEFPQDWSEERKALFAGLTAEQKADILNINKGFQSDYTKKTQSLAEERKALESDAGFAKEIKGVFDDNEKLYMRANGIEEKQAIHMAVANWRMENQDPAQFALQVLQRNGIDPYQMAQQIVQAQAEKTPEQQQMESALTPLQREIEQLKQQISSSNETAVENVLSKFTNAVTETGESKYPHLDAVEDYMANEFRANGKNHLNLTQEDWDRAYENACYANPDIRQSLLEQQKAAQDTQARKVVEATKAATVGKTVKSGTGVENKSGETTFEDLLNSV